MVPTPQFTGVAEGSAALNIPEIALPSRKYQWTLLIKGNSSKRVNLGNYILVYTIKIGKKLPKISVYTQNHKYGND